jgi:hypothetical protein
MESLDNKISISAGFIVSGQLSDIQRLRQVILDFLGAELTPDGHITQAEPLTSVRLIYHTLSRSRLFVVKEDQFKRKQPKWIHEQE